MGMKWDEQTICLGVFHVIVWLIGTDVPTLYLACLEEICWVAKLYWTEKN